MPKAIISVTDKRELAPFARGLVERGYSILSTGGTADFIRSAGAEVEEISDFTGSPEILEGRVKTLHPRVFGSILARPDIDKETISSQNLAPISLVVVNLYQFEKTIGNEWATLDDAIEAIDIGGVSLIRAAAKNSAHVLTVVDPSDYESVLKQLDKQDWSARYRREMAAKAFRHTAAYDALIADYLTSERPFPERLTLTYQLDSTMRYGENPHQEASFYRSPTSRFRISQLQGKQLSYNNIVDLDAAIQCVLGLKQPACGIVKHANPCGLAVGETLLQAYEKAFLTDPTSAFGGIIAFNQDLSAPTLERVIANQFAEVVVAPSISSEATETAKRRPNLRLVSFSGAETDLNNLQARTVAGGLLVQQTDGDQEDTTDWRVVTKRQPTKSERDDLEFAWYVVRHVKSNAIVFVRDATTTGIGAGQMNRVQSVRIAAARSQEEALNTKPSVMASDAFFPFRDGIDEAAKAGISAVIQPGGSVRDQEVISACDEHNLAMIFTGTRHFKH